MLPIALLSAVSAWDCCMEAAISRLNASSTTTSAYGSDVLEQHTSLSM
jgi:PIN domain nuclease of toxin-antitoxin system